MCHRDPHIRCIYNVLTKSPVSFLVSQTRSYNSRHVRKAAKSNREIRHVRPSVRPSAWNISTATERIFMKKVHRENMFVTNRIKMSGAVLEGQSAFHVVHRDIGSAGQGRTQDLCSGGVVNKIS